MSAYIFRKFYNHSKMSRMMVKQSKKDIRSEVTRLAFVDGLVLLGHMFRGKDLPTLKECDSYKALIDYFQKSTYQVKKTSQGTELSVRNKEYSVLNIIDDNNNHWFKKISIKSGDNCLEARVTLDVPILSDEFKIVAAKNNDKRTYECIKLSYSDKIIYDKGIR